MRTSWNLNPQTLLVGMWHGTAALETVWVVLKQLNTELPWASNSTPRYAPKGNESMFYSILSNPISMWGGGTCPHFRWVILGHQWDVRELNSVQLNSDACFPRDGLGFHRLMVQFGKTAPHPSQLETSVTSPSCFWCSWPTGYKSEVPTIPAWFSINLLEWVKKLRKPIYLLDCQLYYIWI